MLSEHEQTSCLGAKLCAMHDSDIDREASWAIINLNKEINKKSAASSSDYSF